MPINIQRTEIQSHVLWPYFIEIKHQIQLTNIPKELIQYLHKEMYRLQIRQLIIMLIHARTEEQTRVPPIHDLEILPELDEVGLVFLVARGHEAVDLAFKFLLFVVVVGAVPFR